MYTLVGSQCKKNQLIWINGLKDMASGRLNSNLNKFKTVPNILWIIYVARWTFPTAHKTFQSYLKIYPIYYEYNSRFKYNNDLNSVPKIFHINVHYFWFGLQSLAKIIKHLWRHVGNNECNFKGSCPSFKLISEAFTFLISSLRGNKHDATHD